MPTPHPPEPFRTSSLADLAPSLFDTARPDALSRGELEVLREIYREPMSDRAAPAPAPSLAEPAARAATWRASVSEGARRVVNVAFAAGALVALAPLMLLIALAVRLSSRGPVIYVQERVGRDRRRARPRPTADASASTYGGIDDEWAVVRLERRREDVGGEPYRMFKFRTMRVDAEAHGRAVWATRDDPRVTRVGRVLRRTRLDELPQLVNVLRGEMNVVGPRPERPSIAARLRREVDGYALRYHVRPGITGWAQINHPYDSTVEDVRAKVRYDLEYLERRCVAEDLRILARTVPVMFGRRTGW